MNRRLLISSAICSIAGFDAAQAQLQTQVQSTSEPRGTNAADLARVDAYLHDLRSLHARFRQVGPDGKVLTGQAWIQRPGRMRFQYDPPAPYLLVANGSFVVFHDSHLGQTSNIPLGSTPLGILLEDNPNMADVDVLDVRRQPGSLRVTLARKGKRGEGSVVLDFADAPLRLLGWTTHDAQGHNTRVSLSDVETGGKADPSLFQFIDPRFFGSDMHG